MGNISDYVNISITRETQAVAKANFGTPAIIAEFPASKTLTTFDRYREYTTIGEMLDDNWLITDEVYVRASKIFGQNPHPSSVIVGRKKPATEVVESWTVALNDIVKANNNWYGFTICATGKIEVTFNADFVASNSILCTINGIVCDPVIRTTDQATTMGLIKTEVEAQSGLSDIVVTVGTTPFRTLTFESESGDMISVVIAVTLGVSQPVATIGSITEDDDILEVASWTETQKKLFFLTSNDANIPVSSSADIASQLKLLNYDRTAVAYHPSVVSAGQYLFEAWMGKMFPKDPGSATWKFKEVSGITTYNITGGVRTIIKNKNCNIYITTAGVPMTEEGVVVSGEYIDIMHGVDWLESDIQETIFAELIKVDKIPFTNEGLGVIEGLLKESLNRAVRKGVLASYEVVMPLLEDISDADKLARNLPDIEFTGILAGAIHKVNVAGIVTV